MKIVGLNSSRFGFAARDTVISLHPLRLYRLKVLVKAAVSRIDWCWLTVLTRGNGDYCLLCISLSFYPSAVPGSVPVTGPGGN